MSQPTKLSHKFLEFIGDCLGCGPKPFDDSEEKESSLDRCTKVGVPLPLFLTRGTRSVEVTDWRIFYLFKCKHDPNWMNMTQRDQEKYYFKNRGKGDHLIVL